MTHKRTPPDGAGLTPRTWSERAPSPSVAARCLILCSRERLPDGRHAGTVHIACFHKTR